jgi:hypothetical protein
MTSMPPSPRYGTPRWREIQSAATLGYVAEIVKWRTSHGDAWVLDCIAERLAEQATRDMAFCDVRRTATGIVL